MFYEHYINLNYLHVALLYFLGHQTHQTVEIELNLFWFSSLLKILLADNNIIYLWVTGEDGCEASSAGQMETFLGVRGFDSLIDTVRKCWASAYTYQAVEYRR